MCGMGNMLISVLGGITCDDAEYIQLKFYDSIYSLSCLAKRSDYCVTFVRITTNPQSLYCSREAPKYNLT